MAEYIENGVRNYRPDDTDKEFWLSPEFQSGYTFSEILTQAQKKWPGISLDQIKVAPEHVHVYCLGYDSYDGGDWVEYLRISCDDSYKPPRQSNLTVVPLSGN